MSGDDNEVLQKIAVNTQHLNSLEDAILFHKKLMIAVSLLAVVILLVNKC